MEPATAQPQHVRQTPAQIILPQTLRMLHASLSNLLQARFVVGDVQFKFQVATVSSKTVHGHLYTSTQGRHARIFQRGEGHTVPHVPRVLTWSTAYVLKVKYVIYTRKDLWPVDSSDSRFFAT